MQHKISFAEFIIEDKYDSSRTSKLTREQFVELIKNNCSDNASHNYILLCCDGL